MSHQADASASFHDDELAPTETAGYRPGEKKSVAEYLQTDANDESLARWKASLGLGPGATAGAVSNAPRLQLHWLGLQSATAPHGGQITLNLQDYLRGGEQAEQALKKEPIAIKEGVTYNIALSFSVGQDVLSGLKYLHVVKRAGVTVDKYEEMIGSYGPSPQPYTKKCPAEDAPSGMLARGTYAVRSRIIDDDKTVWADFTWYFKIAKDW
ncbi:rho GDP dissociation inhibitor [Tilletia horrida]|uniref:Rho GDP dissociation inhibitor n=1 Tax=Tilletia horrida TaxID=155126 RepID=A0AAN6G5N0_9BASI|nr:rho GDP dissociation inhibitor [Tilletia horrida]KAK0539292.1 rho GDP dissociation inhibitor [Tilletia horrida]